jgi:hypothetical protein
MTCQSRQIHGFSGSEFFNLTDDEYIRNISMVIVVITKEELWILS